MTMPDLDRDLYFVLDGHEPVAEPDEMLWARWIEEHKYRPRAADAEGIDDCRVGSTHIDEHVWVSTVFLGINHRIAPSGPPILFETMVFGGPLDQEQERYTTWDEADRGHAAMVERALSAGFGADR